MSIYVSLGKYSTFSDNPSSLLLFLSDFLTFLILSDLFHCFYRGNAWLIFKINVSLADKSDELNMKKITIAIDGFSSCGKSTMAKDLAREVGYIYPVTSPSALCCTACGRAGPPCSCLSSSWAPLPWVSSAPPRQA